jgi:hypothetical protein
MVSKKQKCVINVGGGYGVFLFYGTKIQAEERRANTSAHEKCFAIKRLLTSEEISSNFIDGCLNHKGFNNKFKYSCKCTRCMSYKRQETIKIIIK